MSTLDVVAYAGEEFARASPSRPTSSTSAAAPRPRSWPTGCTSSSATSRSSRCSSTCSAASPSCDAVANGIVGALDDARRRGHQAARRPAGRQQRRGGPAHPRRGQPPAGDHRRDHGRRGPQGRRAGCGRELKEAADQQWQSSSTRLQGHRPGHDRLRGHEAHPADARLRHRTSSAASTRARPATTVDFDGGVTVPVFGTVAEAIEATGANVSVIFVPPAVRQGRRRRGDRRRDPARRRHHRGHRGQGHRGVLRLRQQARARPASSARTAPA